MAPGLRSLLDRGPAALIPPTREPSLDRAPDALAAGIAHPELTASATRAEATELSGRHFDARQPGVLVERASMSASRAWVRASRSWRLSISGLTIPRRAEM